MDQKYGVVIDRAADEDLSQIIHYLMTNYSRAAAKAAMVAINKQIDRLARYPESNPIYSGTPGMGEVVYRYTIAKKVHRIIFTIKHTIDQVRIVAIKHVKADKTRILQEIEEE